MAFWLASASRNFRWTSSCFRISSSSSSRFRFIDTANASRALCNFFCSSSCFLASSGFWCSIASSFCSNTSSVVFGLSVPSPLDDSSFFWSLAAAGPLPLVKRDLMALARISSSRSSMIFSVSGSPLALLVPGFFLGSITFPPVTLTSNWKRGLSVEIRYRSWQVLRWNTFCFLDLEESFCLLIASSISSSSSSATSSTASGSILSADFSWTEVAGFSWSSPDFGDIEAEFRLSKAGLRTSLNEPPIPLASSSSESSLSSVADDSSMSLPEKISLNLAKSKAWKWSSTCRQECIWSASWTSPRAERGIEIWARPAPDPGGQRSA